MPAPYIDAGGASPITTGPDSQILRHYEPPVDTTVDIAGNRSLPNKDAALFIHLVTGEPMVDSIDQLAMRRVLIFGLFSSQRKPA